MCSIVAVQHGSRLVSVQCAAGMEVEEVRVVLASAFGESRRIVGVESAEGVCSPLSLLCGAPSAFESARLLVAASEFGEIEAADRAFREEFGEEAFHLGEVDLREMCATVWGEAEGASISGEAFGRAARAVLEKVEDRGRARAVLARIWRAFERRGTPVAACSVMVGLSALCGGEASLKLSETFALFDADGDGVVSLDEMQKYFEAVFVAFREQSPSRFSELCRRSLGDESGEPDLRRLARATAENCFADADKNNDGVVSFDEFCAWYSSSQRARRPREERKPRDVLALRGDYSRLFGALTRRERLSRSQFARVLVEGLEAAPRDEAERSARLELATALFDAIARGEAEASSADLAAGVAAVCGDPSLSALDLYPAQVTPAVLRRYLDVVAAARREPPRADRADRCFAELGRPPHLSREAVREWATPDLLAAFRGATCLDAFGLRDVARALGSVVDSSPSAERLDLAAFRRCLVALRAEFAASRGLAASDELDDDAEDLVAAAFRAIADDDALIAPADALFGLFAACKDDDAHAPALIFDLLAEDGAATAPNLRRFLDKYFALACALSPSAADSAGLAALALKNALRLAASPDRLSFPELQTFLAKNKPPAPTKLQTAAHVAQLRYLDAGTAMRALAANADPDGFIDKDTFVRSLRRLTNAPPDSPQAKALGDVYDVVRNKTAVHVAQRVPATCIRKLS